MYFIKIPYSPFTPDKDSHHDINQPEQGRFLQDCSFAVFPEQNPFPQLVFN